MTEKPPLWADAGTALDALDKQLRLRVEAIDQQVATLLDEKKHCEEVLGRITKPFVPTVDFEPPQIDVNSLAAKLDRNRAERDAKSSDARRL